jgi:RimJ/RimL family protein N-acetyltransferase
MQLVYSLTTERLIIRALTSDDLDRHHALFSDPEVVRYLYFGPFDRPAAQEHLARRSVVDLPGEGSALS